MNRIQKILGDERSKQPISELRRKYDKAVGRHSRNYWIQEEIDLATAEALEAMRILSLGNHDG